MKTKTASFTLLIATFALTVFMGCDKKNDSGNSNDTRTTVQSGAALPAALFVKVQPSNAKTVEEIKTTAKIGDTVVVRGRVGGSQSPFVEGRAVFTLMGNGLKACSDNADDECKTPWDYCCDTAADIAKHSATIQVVDSSGAPIKASIRGQNGVKELSELVVTGKVVQANEKMTIIAASEIFNAKP